MLFPCLACVAVADTDATFGFPEIRRGALPGVVSVAARKSDRVELIDWVDFHNHPAGRCTPSSACGDDELRGLAVPRRLPAFCMRIE